MQNDPSIPYLPTPEEIEQACVEIRKTWPTHRHGNGSRRGDELIGAVQEIETPRNSLGQPMV